MSTGARRGPFFDHEHLRERAGLAFSGANGVRRRSGRDILRGRGGVSSIFGETYRQLLFLLRWSSHQSSNYRTLTESDHVFQLVVSSLPDPSYITHLVVLILGQNIGAQTCVVAQE